MKKKQKKKDYIFLSFFDLNTTLLHILNWNTSVLFRSSQKKFHMCFTSVYFQTSFRFKTYITLITGVSWRKRPFSLFSRDFSRLVQFSFFSPSFFSPLLAWRVFLLSTWAFCQLLTVKVKDIFANWDIEDEMSFRVDKCLAKSQILFL